MELKGIIWEDMINYKKISTTLMFPKCSFKCNHDCGREVCQNTGLHNQESMYINVDEFLELYKQNELSEAIVCQGLEPFDSFGALLELVDKARRKNINDDIVIYTGYMEEEIIAQVRQLSKYPDIYIKFGRYIPDKASRHDDLLGVTLASDNQYCVKIG